MKVVFADRSNPGGIWNVLHPIAEALRDRGDEAICVRWRDREEAYAEAPEGVRVVQIDVPARRAGARGQVDAVRQLAAFSKDFAALLERERPDVVHANFVLPGAAALRAAKAAGVPRVVLTRHELFTSLSVPLRALDRATRRHADAVTFVSKATARSYGSAAEPFDPVTGEPPPRETVIYNGIDLTEVDAARAAAGPRDADRIVCVGRLVPVKGQATLLRAFARLLRDRPTARLELIGEGPERPALGRLAEDLDVADRTQFLGWRPRAEVMRTFAEAGCVALPSDGTQEGFGLTAAEAAACGAAVAASDIPVFHEVLGEGEVERANAEWFPPGDAAALAEALAACLGRSAPPDLAASVAERFSLDRMTAGHLATYDAGRAGAGRPSVDVPASCPPSR
ncbi:glycosyltransferase [Alienimonas sp. DA493]|uniref:glycosyltransferase n=1 Tax=Alienimonas sp. DA493 TaxID=3373605 RepID=UPI0037540A82